MSHEVFETPIGKAVVGIEEALRRNYKRMQERLQEITPPKTRAEQFERDMLEADIKGLKKVFEKQEQRDEHNRHTHHNHD
jgi:hypothetical protein